ncbi:unnamed protein product [Heterobilharzia americana]|nr:unnamed protein product [Heterobilharzia americana]CAH8550532.1 unnamed protein product [Heterobilharzia americana]
MSLALELRFRSVLSCLIACGISSCVLVLLIFIQNISFSPPWLWITATFLDIMVTPKIFWIACNCLIVGMITHMSRSRLSVTDRIVRKTYQVCGAFFTWSDFRVLMSSVMLGAMNSFVVVKILASDEYSSFFEYDHFPSVNQKAYILTTCGAFMGFMFCLTVLTLNRFTLNYSNRMGNVFVIAKEHMLTRLLTTIGRIVYFLPIYALFPNVLCHLSRKVSFLWLVLDCRLLLLMFFTSFHLQFSWSCAVDVLKSQFIKPVDIPLSSVLKPSYSVQGILNNSSDPLEQHLALERLADLVAINQSVRSSIFSLSHLGGRPVLWKQISSLCMQLIDHFVSSVQKANSRGITNLGTPLWPTAVDFKFERHLLSPSETNVRQRSKATMKPLSVGDKMTPDMQPTGSIIAQNLMNAGRQLFSKLFTRISQTQVVSVLSSEIAYAPTAHLFAAANDIDFVNSPNPCKPMVQASGQVIIWAIEILACLTLASYNEDPFGSVQQSLGQILLLFADGLEAVEKHLRLVGLLTNQHKQIMNCSVTDNLNFSTLSTGYLQTPLRNSKQYSGSGFHSDTQCKISYYRFASDPSLPWRVYATFCWALTNCLNQYGDCLTTISLDKKSKERLQLLKASRCLVKESSA